MYRSMLRKQWINEDTGKVKADAYFLRANEIGLSANLASKCSPEQCKVSGYMETYELAVLSPMSIDNSTPGKVED
jgi:hypothetical protein